MTTQTDDQILFIPEFARLQRMELEKARVKFPPHNSLHESWAILREEVDELWDEIKKYPYANRSPDLANKVLKEVVQVAAMAQRCAEDCNLMVVDHDLITEEK